MEANEIEKIVYRIGIDIFESVDGEEWFGLYLRTNGFSQQIIFCDIVLWNSNDDERHYISDDDNNEEREDLEDFLRRRIHEIQGRLERMKI